MIQHVLNECGQKLLERGYADFGAFVVANLCAGKTSAVIAVQIGCGPLTPGVANMYGLPVYM